MNEKNAAGGFELEAMLPAENVRANVSVNSWQQAGDAVGQLLVDSGKIEQCYVDHMKQNVEEIGPYIVVAPGVALFHARPEDGVLEPCLALITLVEPVEFGHPENDPVDIVIAFGAQNKESHIPALMKLAEQLGNQKVIDRVRNAKTDAALHEAFLCLSEDCFASDS